LFPADGRLEPCVRLSLRGGRGREASHDELVAVYADYLPVNAEQRVVQVDPAREERVEAVAVVVESLARARTLRLAEPPARADVVDERDVGATPRVRVPRHIYRVATGGRYAWVYCSRLSAGLV